MKRSRNDNRFYQILLIPSNAPVRRLSSAWADADQAADFGAMIAGDTYPGQPVEVVVIRTQTRDAVRCRMTGGTIRAEESS
jgi:hypothetical protein